jgi:beta-phosphoglucomutase-like phosphatase (HAD superfamily)
VQLIKTCVLDALANQAVIEDSTTRKGTPDGHVRAAQNLGWDTVTAWVALEDW